MNSSIFPYALNFNDRSYTCEVKFKKLCICIILCTCVLFIVTNRSVLVKERNVLMPIECCRVPSLWNSRSLCSGSIGDEIQNVLSYSIYGNISDPEIYHHYYAQFENRLIESKKMYPGWRVRLYYNKKNSQKAVQDWLCILQCKYDHLDPCDISVTQIPERDVNIIQSLKNSTMKYRKTTALLEDLILSFEDQIHMYIENRNNSLLSYMKTKNLKQPTGAVTPGALFDNFTVGKTWRFLVLADPTIDLFLVRDVDSKIFQREVDAVNEWIWKSNATVHAMRDHPSHLAVMLAGMWGASRSRNSDKLARIFYKMLQWKPQTLSYFDQMLLRKELWPAVSGDIMVHDSYFCEQPVFQSSSRPVPFPTRRDGKYFVGWGETRPIGELDNIKPCPQECKPKDHKNWTFC